MRIDRLKVYVLAVLATSGVGILSSCTSKQEAGAHAGRSQIDTPQLVLQVGDDTEVHTVFYSCDGRWIASGSLDGQIRLWDARTGEATKSFRSKIAAVSTVAFSPNSRTLAVGTNDGSDDNKLTLISTDTGSVIRSWTPGLDIASTAFSPDGMVIAAASFIYEDNKDVGLVMLYDAKSGRLRREYRVVGSRINSIAYSPDGLHLAAGLSDKTVMFWDVSGGEPVWRLKGAHYNVYSVGFSSNSRILMVGCGDQQSGEVILWDVASRSLTRTLSTSGHWVRAVACSPDGKLIASGGGEGRIMFWDPQAGEVVRKIKAHEVPIRALAFSPDGTQLASAAGGWTGERSRGDVRIWQVRGIHRSP